MEYHENELIQNQIKEAVEDYQELIMDISAKKQLAMLFFFFISRLPNCNHPLTGKVYVGNERRHSRVQRNSLPRHASAVAGGWRGLLTARMSGAGGELDTFSPRLCAFPSGCPSFPSTIKNTSSQCPRAMTQHHIEFNPIKD